MLRRLFISSVVAAGLLLVGVVSQANDGGLQSIPGSVVILDHPVPWPWGLEQPFPWSDIQGLWAVADSDYATYFTFKVVREKQSTGKQLQVKQIDPSTCTVVATGVGYELGRIVRAQMTSSQTGSIYRIAIRAFREEDSPRPMVGKVSTSQVMVLSFMDLESNSDSLPVHVQIGKMSSSLDMKSCVEEKNR
jgi:hypothetical protein